jgi:cytochrome c-type protein NapC
VLTALSSPLKDIALAAAALAALILIAFLVRRPAVHGVTKLWLLVGLGVLPIASALAGNLQGYETTKRREFCGSCHVMGPYREDSENPSSPSLASRHARNALFGANNCYVCHADYGMFGTVTTKLGGMRHVWLYYTEYKNMPLETSKKSIHLVKPYPNDNCLQCHSTQLDVWRKVPDHASSLADVRAGRISCASAGCHGYAHPFTKESVVKP